MTIHTCQPTPSQLSPGEREAKQSALRCEFYDTFSSLEGLREAWDQLAIEAKCPIHMSFDWVRLWWEFYGGQKRLSLYVCHSGDRLVAVLPLFIECLGFWPATLRVARVVGANLPPHVLEPPVLAESACAIYEQVLDHLFEVQRCDLLSLGLVSETYASTGGLREACSSKARRVGEPEFLVRDVNTTFPLPGTYDEYFNSLDSKERKIRRKKLRDLEKERILRTEVIQDGTRVSNEFEQFAEQHARQWETEGRPGHFAAWPRGLEFHRALVAAHAERNRVRFVKLFADDILVANQYTFAFGDAIHALLPARVVEPEWHRHSLGCTSQLKLIESSIEDGFKRLESGLGHYDYKVLLNGKETPAGVMRVSRKGAWIRSKVRLYDAIGKVLTLFLHKLWYRRIAPRLGGRAAGGRPAILVRFDF